MGILVVTKNGACQSKRHVNPHLVLHSCGRKKADKKKKSPITIFNKLILLLFVVTNSPRKDILLTSQRLKLHKAATTAAIQDSVLGHCGMGLPMGADFGHTVACIIRFEKRTESHLKFKRRSYDIGETIDTIINSPTVRAK